MEMWSGLCRSCLASSCEIAIVDGEANIRQKYLEVTSIEVSPDDGLPQNLCISCFDSMNSAHKFRSQCIKMDNELRLQLQNFLQNNVTSENIGYKFIGVNEEELTEDEDVDFGSDPVKQLEAIIKTEPNNDSDDDYYYVLVVDPKDREENENTEAKGKNVKSEIIDEDSQHSVPQPQIVKEESQHSEVSQPSQTTQPEETNFESSIDSYIISDKVPINVPATILENEEESQDNDDFENQMNIVDENEDTNSQGGPNQVENIEEDSQDKSNDSQVTTLQLSNCEIIDQLSLPKAHNNFVKILNSAGTEGGTLVLKNNKITYLTDAQLATHDEDDDEDDDDDPMTQEVIFYEGDDSSQFQVLKCEGNELVIEYADDGQIATVLQQEDGTFLCDCGEAFEDLAEYEKHQATHNPAGEHLCTLCGKGFESSEILTGHTLLHSVTGLLVCCPYCDQLIKRNSLTQHIKYSHSNIKPKCNVCLKTFANPNNLKRHMMIHSGVRHYECDICFKRFHQKITMQTHRLTHVNPLACNQCDKIFETTTDLNNHKESDECSKSKILKIKEELMKTVKQEVTTNAGKVVGFACSLCQRMFSVETALEQHVESMHMVNPMELLCSECGEVLPSRKDMQAHLQSHKIVKSKNSKRYECSTCGKGCTSQAMLIMHERVHTNERPYACQLCTLRFKTKTHLRTHQLTHTREKKFGCSVCMKFFALKGNLMVHQRTHTGERPYVCSICGEAFIDSKYLKKHKLKKHSIDNVPWNQY